MNNILIIEDEVKVSEVIKAYLEKEGYKVYCTTKGYDGLSLFNKIDFQLIILDLMLPDIEGEEVCKIIREISDVHIFMLTAKVELSDKIKGLNIGADEYLTKPLSPRELTARVNALFRRVDSNKVTMLSYDKGKIKIDKEKRSVQVELIQNIYGIDFEGSDRTIDVHIKNLRKKIEDNSKVPKYIITVVKAGYKFGGEEDA
ncbi:response regulator transcription factor [Clostridium sp.]|uniref:response regulator transcription factor n=1 Tax=Clostridium sp. TaxID=1506 RepID=UPI002584AFB6|nr:response regulator transcription factor [Clostridium sp.]MDF2503592.1 response regulator with CheY-like receiver domain and winged-helix DNA-binding domain [Clostridium sp.]